MRVPHRWVAAEELGDEDRSRGPGAGDEVRLGGGARSVVRALLGKYPEWGVWTVELTDGTTADVIATWEIQATGPLWRQVEWGAVGPRYA